MNLCLKTVVGILKSGVDSYTPTSATYNPADGEFVIPADVVADMGNGSSNAGAERLYSMMDRIREARHGTTKQPPEVNVNRMMPA